MAGTDAVAFAAEYVAERIGRTPTVLVVLGSGLGEVAEAVAEPVVVPFEEIPGFPRSTVAGHRGRLIAGTLGGVEVLVLQGRFHLYEGWPLDAVALPVRAGARLGPHTLVVTNAAGATRSTLAPGDLMLIADHINFMFRNPLIGRVREGEQRFPDMSDPYDAGLRSVTREVAAELRIPLREGVYAAVAGPSYETPAEVRMLAAMGADAVGMSTVPEVVVAKALGLRVLGISCITNAAAGLGASKLTHDEVLEVGAAASGRLSRLLLGVLPRLPGAPEAGARW